LSSLWIVLSSIVVAEVLGVIVYWAAKLPRPIVCDGVVYSLSQST
jgi:hypothetical protein